MKFTEKNTQAVKNEEEPTVVH